MYRDEGQDQAVYGYIYKHVLAMACPQMGKLAKQKPHSKMTTE